MIHLFDESDANFPKTNQLIDGYSSDNSGRNLLDEVNARPSQMSLRQLLYWAWEVGTLITRCVE